MPWSCAAQHETTVSRIQGRPKSRFYPIILRLVALVGDLGVLKDFPAVDKLFPSNFSNSINNIRIADITELNELTELKEE